MKQDVLELHYNSQNALYLARNLAFNFHTKHIGIHFHSVHDVVEDGHLSLLKIHIDMILVDMLMEPMP